MPDLPHEPLFLRSTNSASGRSAIIEEVEGSVWLYLTPRGSTRPERDCWLCNTQRPEDQQDREYFRVRHLPPPAEPGVAGRDALCRHPAHHDWQIRWSADGQSVAAFCDGRPVGLIGTAPAASHSFHLVADGPWGARWDQAIFERLFA